MSLVPNNTTNVPAGSIKRLDVQNNTNCGLTTVLTSARPTHNCVVASYSLTNDSTPVGSLLVNDQTELAVSDVEPKMFQDTNYPSSNAFLPFNANTGSFLANLKLRHRL